MRYRYKVGDVVLCCDNFYILKITHIEKRRPPYMTRFHYVIHHTFVKPFKVDDLSFFHYKSISYDKNKILGNNLSDEEIKDAMMVENL